MEEIEFDCPVCDDGKKHKAIVLEKIQGEKKKERMVLIVKCLDCGRVGKIIKIGDLGVEMYDFPPPEEQS